MALDTSGSSSLFWKTGISTAGLEKGALKSKGILAGLSSSITKMDVFIGLGISAAAVFVSAIVAVLVGIYLFLPKLF